MPYYAPTTQRAIADVGLGMRVDRATATLPQSAAAAIFNVKGGRVMVTQILGEVTTIIQNQANNTKLQSNPDTGSTVDMSATVDIANLEAGGLLGIAGAAATAAIKANAGSIIAQTTPVIVAAGAIELNCSASNTGSVKWSVWYLPLDDGAYIEAA